MSQIKLDSSLFPKKEEKSTNGNGGINVTPSNGKPTEGQSKENTAFCKMYVDVHEPSDIVEMLRSDKGIYVEIKALEAGDYAWGSGSEIITRIEVFSELEKILNKRLRICYPCGNGRCLVKEKMKRILNLLLEAQNTLKEGASFKDGKREKQSTCANGEENTPVIEPENVGRENEKVILKDLDQKSTEREEGNIKIDSKQKDCKNSLVLETEDAKNVEMRIQEFGKFITWMKLDLKIEQKVQQLFLPKRIGKDCNSCVQIATQLFTMIQEDERFPLERKGNGTGIERKTLQDFYNSIVHGDKHIWKQIFKLKHAFARPLLIIERWDESFFTSSKIKKTVDGAIASIFLMGVSILTIPGRGQNSGNFVDILAFLFYSSDKKALSMRPVPEKTKSPKKKDVLSDVLVMIPFIGRKTANELANHANSIEEICQMKDEDLRKKAPGIRRDGLAAMRWVLNGKEWEKARKENEVKEK